MYRAADSAVCAGDAGQRPGRCERLLARAALWSVRNRICERNADGLSRDTSGKRTSSVLSKHGMEHWKACVCEESSSEPRSGARRSAPVAASNSCLPVQSSCRVQPRDQMSAEKE